MVKQMSAGRRNPCSDRRGRRARLPELAGFASALAAALVWMLGTPHGTAQAQSCSAGGGNFTTCLSTTTGTGATIGGTFASLSQFFATPGAQSSFQRLGQALVVSGVSGGTTTTVTVQGFTTFGPATIPTGPNAAVCNGAPTTWPPGPNCTISPTAEQFVVAAGTTNVNINTHTETSTVLSASSPLFGLVLGDFHTAFQTALLDQNWSVLDALFAQLRGFGVAGAGPGARLPGGQFASLAMGEADAAMMLAERGPDGRLRPSPWFVWARPHGTLGKVDSSSERLGFSYDLAGVSAGLEYRWPGRWLAGGTLGYAHASISQSTTGDKGHIESLQLGAYGGYRDQRMHVLVAALFGQNWISSERLTVLSPATATADYTAQSFTIGVEAGRKYPVLGHWIQPIASLIYTRLHTNSFRESGSTLLEISGDGHSSNSLKLSLGARAWRDFDLGWGVITPEVRARWVQDLLNERRAITGRFVGDATQTAFTVNGAKPTPAAAVIGAGVTLRMGPGFKAAFGYDAEIRSNALSHTLQATLKLVW
jgi:outer membrane autotransporter protein